MEKEKVELITEVKKVAEKLDRAPTTKEFEFFSQAIYRFGSWNNFLKSAGLTPNLTQNNFDNLTNEQLLGIVGKELDRIGSTRAADYNKYKSNAEKFRDEPPIAEDACSCEDTKEFEKIVAAVEKYEWMLEKK